MDDINNAFLPYILRRDNFSRGSGILFTESSTIGNKIRKEYIIEAHRELIRVDTHYGKVQVKITYKKPGKPTRYPLNSKIAVKLL